MLAFEPIAEKIDHHHQLAEKSAVNALEHALETGKLLLEMKARLKHGEFQRWILGHTQISIRKAQRYMSFAAGKDLSVKKLAGKCDTVSHLATTCDQGSVIDGVWTPKPGHHYLHAGEIASYWVVPDINSEGFHVSKLYQTERDPRVDPKAYADPDDPFDERVWDGMSRYDGTNHPIRRELVGMYLKFIGMNDPTTVLWTSCAAKGLPRPFGEPAGSAHEL